MSIVLPAAAFVDIAFELRRLAWREAVGAEELMVFAARNPDLAAFATAARDAALSAERIGEACRLFEALTPHEARARRLLSSIHTGEGRAR